jgi:hypothetical protein
MPEAMVGRRPDALDGGMGSEMTIQMVVGTHIIMHI